MKHLTLQRSLIVLLIVHSKKNLLKSLRAKGVQNCCAALPEPKRIKERNEISYVKLKSMMGLLTYIYIGRLNYIGSKSI
jgi:hypothetical protein